MGLIESLFRRKPAPVAPQAAATAPTAAPEVALSTARIEQHFVDHYVNGTGSSETAALAAASLHQDHPQQVTLSQVEEFSTKMSELYAFISSQNADKKRAGLPVGRADLEQALTIAKLAKGSAEVLRALLVSAKYGELKNFAADIQAGATAQLGNAFGPTGA